MRVVVALVLPLLAWAGCYGLCRELAARRRIHPDWRLSWILASVAWSLLLTLIIEASSALHALTPPVIALAWMASGASLLGLAQSLAAKRGAPWWVNLASARTRLARLRTDADAEWQRTPADTRLFVIGAAVLIAAIGLIAATTACTNYDSMSYHLSRVAHWIDQRSVAFYPTPDWRQLEFGPWAEYAVATLFLLEGGDWTANLVQWFAMLTSVLAATLLVRQLLPGWNPTGDPVDASSGETVGTPIGAAVDASAVARVGATVGAEEEADAAVSLRRRRGALAALLVATVPIGIAEAMTTQNDYVIACWFTCAVSLAVALYYDPPNLWYTLGLGGALAVGFLTKSTMAPFVAPFMGLLIPLLLVRLSGYRLRARLLVVLAITFAVINGPQMWRNYALYGSPMGSSGSMVLLRTKTISVSGMASNVIRNLALYTATGVPAVTRAINDAVPIVHKITGRSINDPDLTFVFTPFLLGDTFLVGDSGANSIYHPALIGLVLPLLFFASRRRLPGRLPLIVYGALVASSFALFCALLRWQPWHSRFHIGFYILMMPLVAIVLVSTLQRWLTAAIGAGFIVLAIVSLWVSSTRPLDPTGDFVHWTHEQQYFLARPTHYASFLAVAEDILDSGCQDVGMHIHMDDWDYPLYVMLWARGFDGRAFNVGVTQDSVKLGVTYPPPCAIITDTPTPPPALIANLPVHVQHGALDIRYTEGSSKQAIATRASKTRRHPRGQ
jgi:hypothetical protein